MTLGRPIKAVLLDVDGTLYQQTALRAFMLLELGALPFIRGSYRSAAEVWKALHAFRQVREELRGFSSDSESLSTLQYVNTAKRLQTDPNFISRVAEEWIYQRPLKYLRFCRRRGLRLFCKFLKEEKIAVGLFSDYPVEGKLGALKLCRTGLWPVLCATDPEVNAFKPHPKGFLLACEMWGLSPDEVLYVGDRYEVDAAGAAAAGMPCAIISDFRRKKLDSKINNCLVISSFPELQHVLVDNHKH